MTCAFTQELAALGKRANTRVGRKASKKERDNLLNISVSRGRDKKGKAGSQKVTVQMNKERRQKPTKVEPLVKEEGEMSDNEEVYEQFKEVKWMEWCQDVMVGEMKTLERLQRLQTTSANLPKEKVDFSFWFSIYLVVCYYILKLMYSISFSFRCL